MHEHAILQFLGVTSADSGLILNPAIETRALYPFDTQAAMAFFGPVLGRTFTTRERIRTLVVFDAKYNPPHNSYATCWLYTQTADELAARDDLPPHVATLNISYEGSGADARLTVTERGASPATHRESTEPARAPRVLSDEDELARAWRPSGSRTAAKVLVAFFVAVWLLVPVVAVLKYLEGDLSDDPRVRSIPGLNALVAVPVEERTLPEPGARRRVRLGEVWVAVRWVPAVTVDGAAVVPEAHLAPGTQVAQRGFWMSEQEVSVELWRSVGLRYDRRLDDCGDDCPVRGVSWASTQTLLERVNASSRGSFLEVGRHWVPFGFPTGWRLPREAEWAWAARGGAEGRFAGSDDASAVAWWRRTSGGEVHPGCTKAPNGYGICDLSGNVAEWVLPPEGTTPHERSEAFRREREDPIRQVAGGSWNDKEAALELGALRPVTDDGADGTTGVRLVRTSLDGLPEGEVE